jgi:hypothetical protein
MSTGTVFNSQQAEQVFNDMLADWKGIEQARIASWERAFEDMRQEELDLRQRGKWVSGPADLLSVIGYPRWENFHSRMLRWLLDPVAPHGLRAGFLDALLTHLYPDQPLPADLAAVTVKPEVFRRFKHTARGTKADLVVWGRDRCFALVIEVKVDAGEQPDQCYRLHAEFKDETGDTRFIFLTRCGRTPSTATGPAKDAFRCLSFVAVQEILAGLLVNRTEITPGLNTARSYLDTLCKEFP